jgi:similar to stage IV sporulation protein
MNRFKRFILGELRVQATGSRTSRLMALLVRKALPLRMIRAEEGRLSFTILRRDLRQAEYCAEKTGNVLLQASEYGLPAWAKRYRNRWGFGIACLLCFAAMGLASQVLWDIRIEGLTTISRTEFLSRLEQYGVRKGMWQWDLSTEDVSRAVLLAYPDLSRLSLTIEGNCLWVRTAESIPESEPVYSSEPMDIVAAKTCILYSIVTEKGTPQAKKGDVVQQGDLLIRGEVTLTLEDESEIVRTTGAKGVVYGQCDYTLTEEIEYMYETKVYETKRRGWVIYWKEKTFSVKNPFRSWETYDTIEENIFDIVESCFSTVSWLPYLSVRRAEFNPYTVESARYTDEEIDTRLRERLEVRKEELIRTTQGVLLAETYRIEETDDGRRAVLTVTMMEEIGQTVPLRNDEAEENNGE